MPKRKRVPESLDKSAHNQRIKSRVLRVRRKKLVEWVKVSELAPKRNTNLNRTQYTADFEIRHNFNRIPDLMAYQLSIDDAFEDALKPFLDLMEPDDFISGYVKHSSLETDIFLPPQRKRNFNKRLFLDRIYETSQSKREFLSNGLLKFVLNITKAISGRGRGSKAPLTYTEADVKKRSIIRVKPLKYYPNACGYQSIAMGVKWYEWKVKGDSQQSRWHNLYQRDSKQKNIMLEFCDRYHLNPDIPLNNEILKTLDSLIDYQLIVIENTRQRFKGTDRLNTIYLLLNNNHYDLITSMPAYLDRCFYCKSCDKGFQSPAYHRCEVSCRLCRTPGINNFCQTDVKTTCSKCRIVFPSKHCYDSHLQNKICKEYNFCNDCERTYFTKRPHRCDEFQCKDCKEFYTEQPHLCYMSPLSLDKISERDSKSNIFVTYDIECMLERTVEGLSHTPILLISETICDKGDNCGVCGQKLNEFYGTDCVERFIEYLLDLSKTAEKSKAWITAYAHNNSGYDGHFVFRELTRRGLKCMDPTMIGSKLIRLDCGNIRFIDSIMFFRTSLSALPKMFGLTGEAKGFFPHLANTPENQTLRCILNQIDDEMFDIKNMNPNRAKDFKIWRKDFDNMTFDLREEMFKYCRSDVRILSQAMQQYRKLFIETTKIDPLTDCFTLASNGLEFFRATILPPKTIGITPIGGYTIKKEESISCKAWLDCKEKEYGPIIREYRIGRYVADGFIPQTKTVFEFNGCKWHGHNCTEENYNREELEKLNEKRTFYERKGLTCVYMWECDWKRKCRTHDRESKYYWKRFTHYINLKNGLSCDARKALHGGRTNNLKFYHIVSGNERLRYLDFTSLYPTVLVRYTFPGAHPKVYTSNFPPIDSVFGFISCKILQPKRLYFPILPLKSNEKLIFPLCSICADEQRQTTCTHTDDERCITGSFVSLEVIDALKEEYKIVEIYEIWHYDTTINDLFGEYINTFYKIKAEASGYPSYCDTDEKKRAFIHEFKEREHIDLDPNKICKNPGLRTLAKLMLNSFWGKFAQRPNMTETKVVSQYTELYNIYSDDSKTVSDELMIDDMLVMSFKNTDDRDSRAGNTSVAIASYVTYYARKMLRDVIMKIENSTPGSVIYFDTDSIVFIQKPNTYCPPVSNFMGDMTDEIEEEFGLNARMTEFYTTGPKCYAYKIETPNGSHSKIKAKGISQNISSEKTLNFDVMREMATNSAFDIENTDRFIPQQQFRCNKFHIVKTIELEKRFNVTSNKRRTLGNETLPYGWVDEDLEDFAELMIDCLTQ